MKMSANTRYLPVRVEPLADEIFTSWIARLAIANGLRVNQLAAIAMGRGRGLQGSDLDRGVWEAPIDTISALTGISASHVQATTLYAYTNYLWEARSRCGRWRHVLSMASRDRRQWFPGLLYCPECLSSDPQPYFRRSWRLAFNVVCDWHHCFLLDRCPSCSAVIRPLRQGVGDRHYEEVRDLRQCWACHASLCAASCVEPAPTSVVDFQRLLLASLERGWVCVAGRIIYSIAYFDGIYLLLSFLDRQRFADTVPSELAHASVAQARYGGYERLNLRERRYLVKRLQEFLVNWPDGALKELIKLRISSHHFLGFLGCSVARAPFWLWDPVKQILDRSAYVPNEQEVHNAIAYLQRNKAEFSKADLCAALNMSTSSSQRINHLIDTMLVPIQK